MNVQFNWHSFSTFPFNSLPFTFGNGNYIRDGQPVDHNKTQMHLPFPLHPLLIQTYVLYFPKLCAHSFEKLSLLVVNNMYFGYPCFAVSQLIFLFKTVHCNFRLSSLFNKRSQIYCARLVEIKRHSAQSNQIHSPKS